MINAGIVVAVAFLAYWAARKLEGEVIVGEFREVESMLATIVLGLIVLFALILPDLNGERLARGQQRLFTCGPLLAWCAAAIPSAIASRESFAIFVTTENIRKTGLAALTVLFVFALTI